MDDLGDQQRGEVLADHDGGGEEQGLAPSSFERWITGNTFIKSLAQVLIRRKLLFKIISVVGLMSRLFAATRRQYLPMDPSLVGGWGGASLLTGFFT